MYHTAGNFCMVQNFMDSLAAAKIRITKISTKHLVHGLVQGMVDGGCGLAQEP